VLDHLIRELNPNHLEAHTALRRLYEARGEFDAAVRVAEREMYLAPEPQRKIARGLEIGLICRDRLGNLTRALQAFKARARARRRPGRGARRGGRPARPARRWKEHVAMLERMLAQVPEEGVGDAGDAAGVVERANSAGRSSSGSPRRPPTSSAIPRPRSGGGGARTTRRPTSTP